MCESIMKAVRNNPRALFGVQCILLVVFLILTVRSALPLDGNTGGIVEIIVPNPASQIYPITITPINPPF